MDSVSVVIPAYNAAAFICDAVDSALAQTYANVQVIVVDDGSTDETPSILAQYRNRITVHTQLNGGLSAARNAGARVATGDWLAFLDADDVWKPQKIERQLECCRTTPLSYTDRFNFGDRGELPEIQSEVTPLLSGNLFLPLLMEGNFINASSVMMSRSLFIRLGGFFNIAGGCEDWDLWLRAAEHTEIGVCPEPLLGYRFHRISMSRQHAAMRRARLMVVNRALTLDTGRALGWRTRRKIWATTFRTNGWDAARGGAPLHALIDIGKAAVAWPFNLSAYKQAVKVCLNVASAS